MQVRVCYDPYCRCDVGPGYYIEVPDSPLPDPKIKVLEKKIEELTNELARLKEHGRN